MKIVDRHRARLRRPVARAACLLATLLVAACTPERPRPSILLFVYDTVRHDATSPYGAGAAVTPAMARLAVDGLVYRNAYAHAPWTLPSHVSLFSGLLPSQHGTGVRTLRAPDSIEMLAEALAAAGYETRAVSENPWVGPEFNVTQGFQRVTMLRERSPMAEFEAAIDAALADRDPARPLFLFVNVMDAHGPYQPLMDGRLVNASTDQTATRDEIEASLQALKSAFCSRSVDFRRWRPIWWQMYLSGVRGADDKLAVVRARLDAVRPLITVATSDHGQAFGEHHLTSHMYSVREPVIRIPLVVHGLDVRPAVIDAAVGSRNVHRSILEWAGARATGDHAPLPTAADQGADSAVVSEYFDTATGELAEQSLLLRLLDLMRAQCTDADRVRGDMRAVIRPPHKLIDYTRYPTELFDLGRDPGEKDDVAGSRADLVGELESRLRESARAAVVASPGGADVSPETIERLRALGYGGETEAE